MFYIGDELTEFSLFSSSPDLSRKAAALTPCHLQYHGNLLRWVMQSVICLQNSMTCIMSILCCSEFSGVHSWWSDLPSRLSQVFCGVPACSGVQQEQAKLPGPATGPEHVQAHLHQPGCSKVTGAHHQPTRQAIYNGTSKERYRLPLGCKMWL